MTKKQQTILAAMVVLTLVIGFAVTSLFKKPANISITVAPSTAVLTIDGKAAKRGDSHVTPGEHTLKARFDGFTTITQKFTATDGKIAPLTVLLNPNSVVGYDYLNQHPEEQHNREALGGKLFAQGTQKAAQKTPIIGSLPYYDRLFTVNYGPSTKNPSDHTATTLYVTYYSDEGRQEANDWLEFKGVNTATAEIVYTDGNTPTGD
ncbi:MAG: hypothetical protein JWM81_628 [Candidatus Saccharibacteria bacterium]|nr:hypothetical protein [Candidatus Saccharibacteria bacterium]